jgi:hypothetical protein
VGGDAGVLYDFWTTYLGRLLAHCGDYSIVGKGVVMRRILLGVCALVGLIGGPFASNVAAGGGHWHVVRVQTSASSPPATILPGSPTCTPSGCLESYTVTAQQTGGLDGTVTNNGTLWLESDAAVSFNVTILGLFTGTVQGCGQGTMLMYYPLTSGAFTAAFSGRVEIVSGSGTGGLAGISGAGSYEFNPADGSSQATLTARCKSN